MPADRPSAHELIATAAEHLAVNVRPALSGHAAFEALIAANLLAIALRELEIGPELRAADERELSGLVGRSGSVEELEALLARKIRDGDFDDRSGEALAVLRAGARRGLRIANPDYPRAES